MPSLEGQTLKGRYRIDELIGRGGMAEVYRAWDGQRNYHVAVKVMREDLAEDPEFLDRFRREAQALAALSHAHIIRFYSFEREGRLAFLVMDYIEGTTLRGLLLDAEGRPLPLGQVAWVLEQACAAVHYAHSQNVLHRDLKPGNLMIQPDPLKGTGGRVLVADFGIAKAADAATATTVMPGTPAYMSPEQCRSEILDARADVYSLGIVAYEMLAGRRPFSGDRAELGTGSTRERIRWEQVHADPPPLRPYNAAVSPELEAVVLKALAKERAARWPTALAFWQALDGALRAAGVGAAQQVAPQVVIPARPEPAPARSPVDRLQTTPVPALSPSPGVPPQAAPLPARELRRRARLPAWAWVLGGLLLAGLCILMAGGARGLLGLSRPTPTALVLVTTGIATRTAAAPATEPPTAALAPNTPDTATPAPPPPATDTHTATPTAQPTAPPPPTATDIPKPTARPTDTAIPTAPPTATPIPSPLPTSTPTSPPPEPTPTPTSPPPPPPSGGQIAFISDRDGNREVYVMNADGGGVRRVTYSGEEDRAACLSPDGGRIAFQREYGSNWEILVINSDGSGERSLTSQGGKNRKPSWSPNGQRIAFASDRSGNWEIHLLNTDGSMVNLTNNSAEERAPAWSAGGPIAFTSDRSGNQEVWVINPDGSGLRQITNNPADDATPSWSPDGRRIAFVSKRSGGGDIYMINADGGGERQLTSGDAVEADPTWSPDGKQIAFSSTRDGREQVWAINADGSGLHRLSDGPGYDGQPCWSAR